MYPIRLKDIQPPVLQLDYIITPLKNTVSRRCFNNLLIALQLDIIVFELNSFDAFTHRHLFCHKGLVYEFSLFHYQLKCNKYRLQRISEIISVTEKQILKYPDLMILLCKQKSYFYRRAPKLIWRSKLDRAQVLCS